MEARWGPGRQGTPSGEAKRILLKLLPVLLRGNGKAAPLGAALAVNLAVSLMGGAWGVVRLSRVLAELNSAPGEVLVGAEGVSRLLLQALEGVDG